MSASFVRSAFASLLLAAAAPAFAQDVGLRLACTDPDKPGVEARLIKALADGKAVRESARVLVVHAGGKTIRFEDEIEADDPLNGLRNWFCDRKGGFILVAKPNVDDTGVLVDEATGATLPGGMQVLFSADRRAYYTESHGDGADANRWEIHYANGALSWEGFDFIRDDGHPDAMWVSLSDPHWLPKGEFAALATCQGTPRRSWQVTLKNLSGRWEWHPKGKCDPISLRAP